MQKNDHKVLIGSAIITSLMLVLVGSLNTGQLSANTMVASNISIQGLSINPEEAIISEGETQVFAAYAETSTGQQPIKASWEVESSPSVDSSACSAFAQSCKVKALAGADKITVKASAEGRIAEAELTISEEEYHSAAEADDTRFSISPPKMILTQGGTYTFTSNIEAGTDPVPVKSAWSINDDRWMDIINCDNSETCEVHADLALGNFQLTAKYQDYTDVAEIEVVAGIDNPFTDELPDWADEYIVSLYNKGIVSGYDDGSYSPTDNVSRGQFVTMIYRIAQYFEIDTEALLANKNCDLYQDLKSDHYAYKPLCFAYYYNWLGDSFGGDNFYPDEPITRQLVAELTYESALRAKIAEEYASYGMTWYTEEYSETDLARYAERRFEDIERTHPHAAAIGATYDRYVFYGNSVYNEDTDSYDRYFYPDTFLNRAEAATILWRLHWEVKWFPW